MERFEKIMVEQCAPTLAKVKVANLFRFQTQEGDRFKETLLHWDQTLAPLGVRVRLLKECPASQAFLIYVYRERELKQVLFQKESQALLRRMGYKRRIQMDQLLDQLSEHLCLAADFPHEIGLFLGYPFEDVEGFIQHGGKNYLCCGEWKVYANPEKARECFSKYRRCRRMYQRLYHKGRSIDQLTVAAS